jgi:murein DD-endopeptidase MepM/ murein hydrolase activator NlpD
VVMLAGCTSSSGNSDAPVVTPSVTVTSAARSGYVFPIRATKVHFGRVHHDYPATDIFAPCGSAAVAVTDAVVAEVTRTDEWTPAENDGATRGGLSVSIVGTDGVRYYGSHLRSVGTTIVPGHRVRAGDVLGRVGKTGSARPTSCHLHFGISPPCAQGDWWNRRGVLAPYPFLTSWRDGGRRSPVKTVTDWRAKHGCPTSAPKSTSE